MSDNYFSSFSSSPSANQPFSSMSYMPNINPDHNVSVQNLGINDLQVQDLMGNPHVRKLVEDSQDITRRLAASTDARSKLLDKVELLQEQCSKQQQMIVELQNRTHTNVPAPNPSVQVSFPSPLPASAPPPTPAPPASNANFVIPGEREFRPATRPAGIPRSVLWNLEDCAKEGAVGEANKSRPSMNKCVRDVEGNPIPSSVYGAITGTAKLLITEILSKLPVPSDPSAQETSKLKTYYKKYYPKEYREVVLRLEDSHELLRLCAPHWKADHVVQSVLTAMANPKKGPEAAEQQSAKRGRTEDSEEVASTQATVAGGAIHGENGREAQDRPAAKKARTEAGSGGNKGKSAIFPTEDAASSQLSSSTTPISSGSPTPQIPLSQQLATLSSATLPLNGTNPVPQALPGIAANPVTAPRPVAPTRVDVDFVLVDPSVELKTLIPTVECVADFLNAIERYPNHFTGQPSEGLSSLITAIEDADPNAPGLSEDDTNANWGHQQLSGAWRMLLSKWENIGNATIACKLVAAVARTCKVARLLCTERKISANSFLCDNYLEQMIASLWACWREAGGPIVEKKKTADLSATGENNSLIEDHVNTGVGEGSADTVTPTLSKVPSKPELEKLLSVCIFPYILPSSDSHLVQGLLIEDLKTLCQTFKLTFAKKPLKEDIKKAIVDSPFCVSEAGLAELRSLSQARKELKKKKKD
ncbi:hypothetical protein CVT26_001905 [Gymnopilus dilepis]|uniref:Uncharacterized protein n=1 Tax=Gymnopilus dilepis TaxID=231916 RepID=A0A409Y3X5_9AGAR|nr:hypothetical protein CVT26_001905 [Gymnopilus dilepis]